MAHLDPVKIRQLERLVYAAGFNGALEYLKVSENADSDRFVEPTERIAILGIENSIEILLRNLQARTQGFDWERDAAAHKFEGERKEGEAQNIGITYVTAAVNVINYLKNQALFPHEAWGARQVQEGVEVQVPAGEEDMEVDNEQDFSQDADVKEEPLSDDEMDVDYIPSSSENDDEDEPEEIETWRGNKFEPDGFIGKSKTEHLKLMANSPALRLKDVKVFLMFDKTLFGATPSAKFLDAGNEGRGIDIYFGYTSKCVQELLQDELIINQCDIYETVITFEHDPQNPLEYCEHLLRVMLLYISLTVSHYQFHHLKVRTWFNFIWRSLMNKLALNVCKSQYKYIKNELEYITKNPNSVFCINCDEKCQVRKLNKCWHIPINKLQPSVLKKPSRPGVNFLERVNFFQNTSRKLSPFYISLIRTYEEITVFNSNSVKRTLDTLKEGCDSIKGKTYCSYLLLIVDDVKAKLSAEKPKKKVDAPENSTMEENVDNEDSSANLKTQETGIMADDTPAKLSTKKQQIKTATPLKELLESQDLFLYAGQTEDDQYRRSHFSTTDITILKTIISDVARVFLLRNCKSDNSMPIALDEAFLITLLREVRDQKHKENPQSRFYMVNQRQEPTPMYRCKKEIYDKIINFCKSSVPFFNPYNLVATVNDPCEFEGNCGLEEITDEITFEKLDFIMTTKAKTIIKRRNTLKQMSTGNRLIVAPEPLEVDLE